jgi:hypothetical protein
VGDRDSSGVYWFRPKMPTMTAVEEWVSTNVEQRAAVLAELDQILMSSHFRISKRYPGLLKFVVHAALDGRSDEVKERTIGIEVFGRELSYDTNLDPVVRVTAAEVRKRLHQYYENPEHRSTIRIHLSSGSYVPHFIPRALDPPQPTVVSTDELVVEPAVTLPVEAISPVREDRAFSRVWLLAAVSLCLALVAVSGWWRWHQRQATNTVADFWKPFLNQTEPILISVGPMPTLHAAPLPSAPTPEMGLLEAVQHYNIIPLADAITLSKISSFLGSQHAPFRVMNSETTTFDELQSSPVVLTGALNNQWTVRLTSKLRFYFEDSPDISSIRDRTAKVQPDWKIYRSKKYASLVQDYAVVGRYHDVTTGRMVIIAAGIGPNGTLAAGDFLTRSECLRQLLALAPAGWGGEGVEAVITTEVINGNSGPPKVVASQFW